MDSLSDISSCCRALTSDKISERKKSVEKLKLLLGKKSVLKSLDENSDTGQSAGCYNTWNDIFKVVVDYIAIETTALQKSKESQSSTAALNKEKKKQEISGFFKFFVRVADKRGPRLKGLSVIKHVLNILNDDFTCSAFGQDYTAILLKNILPIRKYWMELTSEMWHDLLVLCCQLYLDPKCRIDNVLLAKTIKIITHGTSRQCDIQSEIILRLFTEAFKNIRKEKVSQVSEYLLSALNVFSKNTAASCRLQLIKLGETIFVHLLYLWKNRPTNDMKDEIVEFMRLQLQLHHPHGAKTVEVGAAAVDWDSWKSSLRKLYEVMYCDMKQMGGRFRFLSSAKDCSLSLPYVDLAADVCNQLFSDSCSVIEVTQLTLSGEGDTGIPSKKRKLESGWSSVIDILASQNNDLQIVPWLQLVGHLVDKYPKSVQDDQLIPLLQCLSQLLNDCKRSEIHHVFSCLEKLVQGYHNFGHVTVSTLNSSKELWLHIWSASLRTVSSYHAEVEGFQQPGFALLTAIMENGLIVPEKEIWNLFLPSVSFPSEAAVRFLATFLRLYDLPENYKPSILGSGLIGSSDTYPLRKHLLDWLFPRRDVTEIGAKVPNFNKIDPDLAGKVLTSLTVRNPSSVLAAYKYVANNHFSALEDLYMQTSFDYQLNFERIISAKKDTDPVEVSHIPVMLDFLFNLFEKEKMHLENLEDVQLSNLENLTYLCCLVTKCLQNLLCFKIISQDAISDTGLYHCLQMLFKKLTVGLEKFIRREGPCRLTTFIEELDKMFVWQDSEESSTFIVLEIPQSLIPSNLIDLLVDVAFDKLSKALGSSSKSQKYSNRYTKRLSSDRKTTFPEASRHLPLDDFDDMDIEFDDVPKAKKEDSLDLSFDDIEIGESQDSEENPAQSEACTSLLSRSLLSDSQRLRLQFIQVLAHISSFQSRRSPCKKFQRAQQETRTVKCKLLHLLDKDIFDAASPFDLQSLDIIINELATDNQYISEGDLESMICALRQVVKSHRYDQDVTCLCLQLLSLLVPHLVSSDNSLSASAKIALMFVSAYLTLQKEGKCCSSVRLALTKCMKVFIETDPYGEWSVIKGSSSDETTTVVLEFPNCLLDTSHSVRMYTAEAFFSLFVTSKKGQCIPKEKKQQLSAFDKIYEVCNDLLEIKRNNETQEKIKDEQTNRTASCLLALGTVACASPVCEKNCLFAFCQLIREKNIAVSSVHKILHKMAQTLNYKEVSSYISSHLPFLIHQWLDLKYPYTEFPFQLMSISNKNDFYRSYKHILVPELLVHQQLKGIQEIAESLQVEMVALLTDCVPVIVVHILPPFAASKSEENVADGHVKQRIHLASKCYDMVVKLISKETLDSSIVEHIDKIIVNILMCLYDEKQTDDNEGCDPDPNPPCYNSYIIKSTLDYLTQNFRSNPKSLVLVLAKTRDSIQKVLLELSIHLSHEHRAHEKCRILCMYSLFVVMVLKEFQSRLKGSWCFVFRDVVYRVVHILRKASKSQRCCTEIEHKYNVEIMERCLDLLYKICHTGVEMCPQELMKYMPWIVSNTIQVEGNMGQKAHCLLDYLIVENFKILTDGIIKLDPFPEKPVFQKYVKIYEDVKSLYQFSLTREIQHFVEVCGEHQTMTEENVEGIRHLYTLLSTDLSTLVHHSSERSTNSLLCQLIGELLHLTQSSVEAVSKEAARCLGIIGPVDLCAVSLPKAILKTELSKAMAAFSENASLKQYCQIFHQLNEYLVDSCIDVVKSAGDVLKSMFATQRGAEFYNLYKNKLSEEQVLLPYLHPFSPSKSNVQMCQSSSLNANSFYEEVDCDMWVVSGGDYDVWLKDITCALIQSGAVKDEILQLLKPICMIKSKFCETILPFLIHNILLTGDGVHQAVLSSRIATFFHKHCELVNEMNNRDNSSQSPSGANSICLNKDAVQTMLKVVQYLRQQERSSGQKYLTHWDNNFWLDIDYLEVAKAAKYCGAYFSTILFSEIWADTKRDTCHLEPESRAATQAVSQKSSQRTPLVTLSSSDSNQICIQNLMLEAYHCIGDPDGIYGCGAGKLADTSTRVKTYLHENKWEKAVITYDIEMKNACLSNQLGLLETVQNFGAETMLEMCLKTVTACSHQNISPEVQELQYEAAWRAGQWNLDVPSRLDSGIGYHQALYCALDALKNGQSSLCKIAVNSARFSVLKSGDVSMESCRNIYRLLCKLHCLAQVDDVLAVKDRCAGSLLDKWNSEKLVINDFEFVQPVLNMKCSLIKLLMNRQPDKGLQASLNDHLHKLAQVARDSGRYQIAERCFFELKESIGSDTEDRFHIDLEEAKLYWAREEQDIAKHLIKILISNLEKLQDESVETINLLAAALGTYGNWLAETHSENPTIIMDNYLEQSVSLLKHISADNDLALEACLSLAQFLDAQYQNIVSYTKSSTYEAKRALMKKAKEDMEMYKSVTREGDQYIKKLEKHSAIDEQEVVTLEEDRKKFLEKAVENYIKCLKLGDKHDMRVFRLTSLWFENASSEVVNQLINKNIPFIKSYKFLPLLYQLAARMSIKQNHCPLFQPTLEKILETAGVDHPHHGLAVIMGLAHANKDAEFQTQIKRRGRAKPIEIEEDRVQAAKNLIEKLKNNVRVSGIVRNLEVLSTAYIELAYWSVEKYKTERKPINLPESLMITKLKNLDNLAVPTEDTKIDPSGNYSNIVTIQQFLDTFKLAGGINLPKILTVIGSDGMKRRQLVKGRDDLRQDAVMQQVFSMLNNLLKKNPETRKRNLRVRTYKVIPLSQQCGLLEWCEDTQPIGEYLIGSHVVKGAHEKYYQEDWSPLTCRKQLMKVHSSPDVKKKLAVYLQICRNFHPVFRHFFMEKFSDPATWFERRLSYTHSVATNSVVGYILGLGDRHIMNILIDCNTAELIHIDLGIAFEQGRILPTPETVPFRLTRDIVDGMGVSGVEGVFRRCCEKTMEVMHGNQEVLLMILQVLLYDPLYEWTLSPQKAYALQHRRDRSEQEQTELNSTSVTDIVQQPSSSREQQNEVNKVAERVLLRLHQKLQGIETGIQLSITGQVNYIIQEARDPENLCRLYPGWQAYV